jgi:hypothetical protein
MTTPREDVGAIRTGLNETGDAKLEWHAPKLTVLGDATALTQALTSGGDDGLLGSS